MSIPISRAGLLSERWGWGGELGNIHFLPRAPAPALDSGCGCDQLFQIPAALASPQQWNGELKEAVSPPSCLVLDTLSEEEK